MVMNYGEVWLGCQLEHLQHLQDRAQALIEGAKFGGGWHCKWLSVSNLKKYGMAIMIYKAMNSLCPDSFKCRIVTESEISNYSTRNRLILTSQGKIWNSQRKSSLTKVPKHRMRFHVTSE